MPSEIVCACGVASGMTNDLIVLPAASLIVNVPPVELTVMTMHSSLHFVNSRKSLADVSEPEPASPSPFVG